MTNDDEAVKFWSDFERETGEKVVARSIGELYESPSDVGVWGIIILTDKCFRFKRMKSDNWLSALFRGASKKDDRPPKEDLVIRREALVSMDTPKRNLFAKLFGPAFPRFALRFDSLEGELEYVFSSDPSTGIVEALRKAIPSV
jgi:hypothetical protein